MNAPISNFKMNGLALLCGLAGGVLGYFTFFWLANQGFYGMIVPGGLIGLGAALVPNRHIAVPIVCTIAAIALGIFCEWHLAPFIMDASFSYFLTHLQDLQPATLLMMAIGAALAYWLPNRRRLR